MSDTQEKGTSKTGGNPFFPSFISPQVKDTAIFIGWIAGLVLIAGLSSYFTQPLRDRFLVSAVNRVLQQSGDSRRLGQPLISGSSASFGMGSWFSLDAEGRPGTRVFVFAFIGEGTFFPCAAIVGPEGRVEEFIPLNSHGERILARTSPGILHLYSRRIEGAGP